MAKQKIISNEFIDGILVRLNAINEDCRKQGIPVVIAFSVHPDMARPDQSKCFHEVFMANMDMHKLGFAMMLFNQRAINRLSNSGNLELSEL